MNLEAGNVYEFNKNLVKSLDKQLKGKALHNKINEIIIPYFRDNLKLNNYFMLLCHDKRDYSIFNCNCEYYVGMESKIALELKELLENRGAIYSIGIDPDNFALELWINYDYEDMVCYYLFPYDEGVVDCRE